MAAAKINCVHIAGSDARDSTSVLLGDVLASRVPVCVSRPYRAPLQRKKCCQQIIGLNDESLPVAVCSKRARFNFQSSSRITRFNSPVRTFSISVGKSRQQSLTLSD